MQPLESRDVGHEKFYSENKMLAQGDMEVTKIKTFVPGWANIST